MSPHDLLLPLLGLVTGLLLGLLGSGGSILALPAFVYAAGLPVKSSVATSLAVVGATSLIGAILAKRRCSTHGCPGQEVDGRVTALMTVGGLAGAFAGSRLAALVPAEAQMLLFGLVMLGAAAGMLRRRPQERCDLLLGKTKVADPAAPPRFLVLPLGVGVGLLTGVVGVGGGFLIVPALTLLARVPVKRAAAMSLWIIAANSLAGLVGYLGHVPIAWGAAGLFLAVAVVGLGAGQRLAARAQPQGLQTAFALFLVVVGCFTLFKTQIAHTHVAPRTVPAPHSDSRK
jgi:uncharacterized membrane protein YfcA